MNIISEIQDLIYWSSFGILSLSHLLITSHWILHCLGRPFSGTQQVRNLSGQSKQEVRPQQICFAHGNPHGVWVILLVRQGMD